MTGPGNLASRLRHRVTLQRKQRAEDDAGGFTESWETLGELWAEITPLAASLSWQNEQRAAAVTHHITIRHRQDALPGMRIEMAGRYFEILGIVNIGERDAALRLLAREEQGA